MLCVVVVEAAKFFPYVVIEATSATHNFTQNVAGIKDRKLISTSRRPATSTSTSSTETVDPTQILAQQRLNRPVSPHLTIYRPQISWYLSALNRITGSVLSGGLYVFATAYLVAPAIGWHLESASLAAAFGALPLAAKFAIKLGVAMPFTFHCMNGVRHLIWDLGKKLSNKEVIATGWTVVGLSMASAFALALI
ncbi:Succinate dehydrogenase cytochrome b subunit family protein [Coccidioides posadasii C735 delta SOWgp]|uniref:Succinate dehydrogenase cytochrome b subunit family protein n=1 Tax=Coccidioides posadasii (strain C735) TaxID=222929 RepID=C5P4V3_COCP7|nr:Succinate dehydrogenase cytochrome b subunit family protein [Coccidioides posadasii C735 delta SOWgp]EER27743.1 Succinate dehydrogenase cytochrome b subunit family protein [Coccidioides posadasii C735 delta SOWgp]|eukprot:XP_003069888.1 Succinate dehydrogenase cytochrome b subunit family protein [Coccidioides posadasii C735 delta SOWgp]